MRLAILAHNLRFAGGRSVGINVISALARVANEHEYLLFMPRNLGYEDAQKPERSSSAPRRRG